MLRTTEPGASGGATGIPTPAARRTSRGHRVAWSPPRAANCVPRLRSRELVVIGRDQTAQSIQHQLEGLQLRVRSVPELAELRPMLSPATFAVVLVEPLTQVSMIDAVAELGGHGGRAVFVVVPEGYPADEVWRLYDAGSTAVFAWPQEALGLPAMTRDLLAVTPRRGAAQGGAALALAVRARLRLADAKVTARLAGGVIVLRGQVGSCWKKAHLVDMLSRVPGVTAVCCKGVEIVPVVRSDAAIRRDVLNALMRVQGPRAEKITVEVQAGVVELRGTVGRHGELGHLVSAVGDVEGVQAIHSYVVVSLSNDQVHDVATRLRERIEARHPHARAVVTVFGYIAVIDGHAPSLAEKQAIAALARDTPGIGRVVDKLVVAR